MGQRHFGQLLQVGRREARYRYPLFMQHLQGLLRRPQRVVANHQTAACQQHTEPALLGAVESERHKVQLAAGRGQFIQLNNPLTMPRNRLAGHGHAFGLAGGTGGVNQVRQMPGQCGHRLRRCGQRLQLIQQQTRCSSAETDTLIHIAVAQQQARTRVAEHESQALGRVIEVQRQVRRTSLEHRQKGHEGLFGARQGHRHQLLRANTLCLQLHRQRIGLSIQRGIAQFATVTEQRRGVGLLRHLRRKAVQQIRHRGCVLRHLNLCPRQADVTDQARSVQRQLRQQAFQLGTNALHLIGREAFTQVQVFHLQPLFGGTDHQVHREVGHAAAADFGKLQFAVLLPAQGAVNRMVFEHDNAVEQALAALPGPALNVRQRCVFKVANRQVVVLQLTQPVAQRLLRIEGLDDRQGVDEQPEHVLRPGQLGRSPGHGRAEGHAALTGVTLQQQQPCALNQRVQRHPLGAGKALQTAGRVAVEVAVEHAMPAAVSIGRIGQNRRGLQPAQAFTPEAFGARGILPLQPVDVVAIAPGQSWQGLFGVQAQHFAQQARGTPAVQQQVMVSPDHLVLAVAQAHQGKAHQRRAAQIKATGLIVCRQRPQRGFGLSLFTPVQLNNRQLGVLIDRLQRIRQTVTPHKGGAQHFVTCQQRAPGGAESLDLQALHRHAELVNVEVQLRRLDAVEQHALLHRRQRVQVIQRAAVHLHRHRHLRKGQSGYADRCVRLGIHRHGGQPTDGLRLEQLLGGKRQPARSGTAHRLQRDDRIAAQFEEVFGDTNRVQPQQFLPDAHQQHLGRCRRWHPIRHLTIGFGRRQRLTVKLAVGGQRQCRQAHQMRRQHVRGQTAAQVGAQVFAQLRLVCQRIAGHDIARQLTADRAFTVHHKGFAHALMLQQAGFDLAQFDAETANLHLLVDAPQILHHPVFTQPRQIATAIQARTRDKRVRYKTFGGQFRALVIAPSDAFAAQVQLTRHPHRQQLQVGVEDIGAALADRTADGQKRRVKLGVGVRAPDQRRDHGFGRAVAVDDARRLQHPLHFIKGVFGHAFTAHGVGANRQAAPRFADVIGHLQQVAGGKAGNGDAVALNFFAGALRAPDFIVTGHQRRAEDQRGQPALVGTVKADGGELQLAVVRGHAVQRANRQAMHGQRAVGDADAFGPAGGAGGVNQVRQITCIGQVHRVAGGQMAHRFAVQFQHRQAVDLRQCMAQPRLAEQQRNAAVLHQIVQALGRIRRVEGHIGATGLENRQQANNHLRRTFDGQTDPHFRANPQLPQAMGQTVGALVKVGVAELRLIEYQRQRLGTDRGLCLDQLMHALLGDDPRRGVPVAQLTGLLGSAQQRQLAEADLRRGNHGVQQAGQVLAHAGNGGGLEMAEQEAPGQAQLTFADGGQRQRVVGALMIVRQRETQTMRCALLQGLADREVFEHQQAVEQRLTGTTGPALYIAEGGKFVLAQFKVVRLQAAQPVRHAFCGVGLGDHRQGIDKQAQLVFSPRQVDRSPGNRGAECHRLLAAVPLQQQRPGALHQGVEGDAVLAGKAVKRLAAGGIEQLPMIGVRAAVRNRMGKTLRQQGRVLQRRQLSAPKGFVRLSILPLQPTDVIGETALMGSHLDTGIALQHFAQQQGVAPAIEQ